MSRRTVVLTVALILAAVAAVAVWRYLASVEDQVRGDLEEVLVYKATSLIADGTPGSEAGGSIDTLPALVRDVVFEGSTIVCAGPVDPATASDPAVCDDNPSDIDELLTDGVAAGPISQGQVITTDLFVEAGASDPDRLATDVPEGKMAVAMSPDEVGAVGQFVEPADRVNVLATLTFGVESIKELLSNPETRDLLLEGAVIPEFLTNTEVTETTNAEGEVVSEVSEDALSQIAASLPDTVTFTRTILQNIPVLAVGSASVSNPQGLVDESGDPVTVTSVVLEVLPDEAELLEFARQNGVLGLSLLPAEGEYTELDLTGATMEDVTRFAERLITALENADGG